MRSDRRRYVIECRTPDGKLDFAAPQPESVFGMGAINGISADDMAMQLWQFIPLPPGATDQLFPMDGREVERWPSIADPRWSARIKTW